MIAPGLESGLLLADRYVLRDRLGDGGHAEVWAADDTQQQRRVALKFLHLHSCAPGDAWRVLQHESAMAQRLEHEGVLSVGPPERDGERVFLPMEYASGGDVRMLRGAPWRQVLPVLQQVAAVLEHAHSRGVVHRDVKPGNVLFDAEGRVRVTDFGTAARTGSTAALADGSPFSASPQQLRGDAATTADDVYGLGALAYELLSRYPPHYPDFDAQRVQTEMPAALVPAHPAPPVLLDFIMSMLARDPVQRPDIRQVLDYFRWCLSAEAAELDAGGTLLVAGQVQQPVSGDAAQMRPARRMPVWVWLVAAAVAVAVFFIWLPSATPPVAPVASAPTQAQVDAPQQDPEAARVAQAQAQAEAEKAAAQQAAAAAAQVLEQDLAAGRAALQANQPAQARAAFERVLLRDAANEAARSGVSASELLQQSLDQYSLGMRAEAAGDLVAARAQYAAILRRGSFAPATAALARVQQAEQSRVFENVLAQAAAALGAGRIADAEQLYGRAATLHADDPRVRDGQERVAEVRRNERNAADLAKGAGLEQQEKWSDAVVHYHAVLDRDASLRFAVDGLARSERRAALDRELQDYIDRPERLTAAAVRAAAMRALARGEATTPRAPRLAGQLQGLKQQLSALDAPARVEIASDNSTVISVAPLGELGTFSTRELELPPGQYVLIGRREGFRDVRRELSIAPGQQRVTISVQCTERI
jgi:hypothetical protein